MGGNAFRYRIEIERPTAGSASVIALCVAIAASGCGGGTPPPPPPPPVRVALTAVRGGLTVTQSFVLSANVTNDFGSAGVTWSATAGTFSTQSTTSASFVAPTATGPVIIKATSVADPSKSASSTVVVTDLAGVYTYHNDLARDGVNLHEFALTTSTVGAATFGKLFSCPVDGAIYAQPLWVANLTINNVKHNVVVVATQHDSVYAFDADASPCSTLWHANLLDAPHGATTNETSVPSGTTNTLVGAGFGDIKPEIGVTGTPVIDPATNTIYLVSKSATSSLAPVRQRLHALSLVDGSEKFSGPKTISASVPGSGYDASGGVISFNSITAGQRAGLALVNGIVYVCWASHEDADPYHGWVMAFSASNLNPMGVYNDTPNGTKGGIWMAGGAPSVDAANNLYVITGNGDYDGLADYGDSIVKLSAGLALTDSFTPSVQMLLQQQDLDLGSGGAAVLIDLPTAPVGFQHLLIGGGKGPQFNGVLYMVNRDNLGQYNVNDSGVVQEFAVGGGVFATPSVWNYALYIAGQGTSLQMFSLNSALGQFNGTAVSQSAATFGFPGATPSISASSATANGIVWAIDSSKFCTNQSSACGPAVLHAFDASKVSSELWNSSQNPADAAGFAVKFTVPTVANGKVYLGTRGNDTGLAVPSVPGELDVYGLKPN